MPPHAVLGSNTIVQHIIIFISLPAVDEHRNAAPSADHSVLARNVRSPSVGVHHVVCAILGDQQDMEYGVPYEVDVEWIKIA
jgi:hypothetical protein